MKKIYKFLALALSMIILMASLPIMGLVASAEEATETVIFAANPNRVGGEGADATATHFTTNSDYKSTLPVTVNKDDNGLYYHAEGNGMGASYNSYSYFKSGYNATDLPWLADAKVTNAIVPYLRMTFKYRVYMENSGYTELHFSTGVADSRVNDWGQVQTTGQDSRVVRAFIWKDYIQNVTSWTAADSGIGKANLSSFADGYIYFQSFVFNAQWPNNKFMTDMRDIQFTISTADYAKINAALAAAGSDYTVEKLLKDWEDANAVEEPEAPQEPYDAVVFAANPDRVGGVGADATATYFTTNPDYKSYAPVTVKSDANGKYYHTEYTGKGDYGSFSYFKSGYNSTDLPWLADAKVTNAIVPYLRMTFQYRVYMNNGGYTELHFSSGVADSRVNNWEQIQTPGQDGRVVRAFIWKDYIQNVTSWTAADSGIGKANLSSFADGYIYIRSYAYSSQWPDNQFMTDIRDIQFTIHSDDFEKIDAALAAAGSDYTIEKILSDWEKANANTKTYNAVNVEIDGEVDVTFGDNVLPTNVQTVVKALAGDTVTAKATLKSGYVLGAIDVVDVDGNNVELTKIDDTTYSFVMPEKAVTISVAESLPGDYNDDDLIDIRDLIRLKKHLADSSVVIAEINDFDIDGIDLDDLVTLRKALLNR